MLALKALVALCLLEQVDLSSRKVQRDLARASYRRTEFRDRQSWVIQCQTLWHGRLVLEAPRTTLLRIHRVIRPCGPTLT